MVARAYCGFEAGGALGDAASAVPAQTHNLSTGTSGWDTDTAVKRTGARSLRLLTGQLLDSTCEYKIVQFATDGLTIYVQVAVRFSAIPSGTQLPILILQDTVPIAVLQLYADVATQKFGLYVINTGGDIQSTTGIAANTWYLLTAVWKNVNGAVEKHLYVDGVLEASDTTAVVYNATLDRFFLGTNYAGAKVHSGCITYLDDLYLSDSSGSVNTGLPGDYKILPARPITGSQTHNDWTGTYADVDEVPSNEATDYINSTSSNGPLEESYPLETCATIGIPGDASIIAVSSWAVGLRNSGTGTDIDLGIVDSGGTSRWTDWSHTIETAWDKGTYFAARYDSANPADSAAWEQSDFDAIEVAVRKAAAESADFYVSTMLCEVVYEEAEAPPVTRRIFIT